MFLLDLVHLRVDAPRKHGYEEFTIQSRRSDLVNIGKRKLGPKSLAPIRSPEAVSPRLPQGL